MGKNGDTLVPRTVSAGASSGELTEITEGLADGEVVAIGLSAASEEPAAASVERSPFMPSPPGGDKGKSNRPGSGRTGRGGGPRKGGPPHLPAA